MCFSVISSVTYTSKLMLCVGAVLLTFLASLLMGLVIALALNALGRTMSWFARPFWLLFLYVVPTMIVSMSVLVCHSKYYNKVSVYYRVNVQIESFIIYFIIMVGTVLILVQLNTDAINMIYNIFTFAANVAASQAAIDFVI